MADELQCMWSEALAGLTCTDKLGWLKENLLHAIQLPAEIASRLKRGIFPLDIETRCRPFPWTGVGVTLVMWVTGIPDAESKAIPPDLYTGNLDRLGYLACANAGYKKWYAALSRPLSRTDKGKLLASLGFVVFCRDIVATLPRDECDPDLLSAVLNLMDQCEAAWLSVCRPLWKLREVLQHGAAELSMLSIEGERVFWNFWRTGDSLCPPGVAFAKSDETAQTVRLCFDFSTIASCPPFMLAEVLQSELPVQVYTSCGRDTKVARLPCFLRPTQVAPLEWEWKWHGIRTDGCTHLTIVVPHFPPFAVALVSQ